jgi:uncharacterized membrane protein YphA (DoxX/SURF4 family)
VKKLLVALLAMTMVTGFAAAAQQPAVLGDVAGVTLQDDAALQNVRGEGLLFCLWYMYENNLTVQDVVEWVANDGIGKLSLHQKVQLYRWLDIFAVGGLTGIPGGLPSVAPAPVQLVLFVLGNPA